MIKADVIRNKISGNNYSEAEAENLKHQMFLTLVSIWETRIDKKLSSDNVWFPVYFSYDNVSDGNVIKYLIEKYKKAGWDVVNLGEDVQSMFSFREKIY